jgi:hypothetical protein
MVSHFGVRVCGEGFGVLAFGPLASKPVLESSRSGLRVFVTGLGFGFRVLASGLLASKAILEEVDVRVDILALVDHHSKRSLRIEARA